MKIPIIDFASYDDSNPESIRLLANDVNKALTEVGFMSLTNIGIPTETVNAIFQASKDFFAQPLEEKRKLAYTSADDNFGYQGIGEESLEPGKPPDLKESLTVRNFPAHMDVDWPDTAFRDQLRDFYDQCVQAAYRVQRVFAADLGVDSEFFVKKHLGENITMRLLHYPPIAAEHEQQLGAGAHTDYGMLTLLYQDMVGGLEVQDDAGVWQAVDPVPETVVINAGDMTQAWTNNQYKSTHHRVQPRAGASDRYSVVLFVDPDSDVMVEPLPSCVDELHPPAYEPITAGEHILRKIQNTHHVG